MPLRRHASSSHEAASPYQSRTPRSFRTNGDRAARHSSSHSSPSPHQPRTNGHASPAKGSGRATLGDLIQSSRPLQTPKVAKRVIELLDSSDDEEPRAEAQQHLVNPHDLDDIVTPELPPADASAPPLPDDLVIDLVSSPVSPSTDVFVDAQSVITSTQIQSDSNHTQQQPSSPPEPSPDPLANQRPLFDPEELEMQPLYDNLKALLETEQVSDADDDDEDYEQRRLRKLRQNDALLAQLGLAAASTSSNPVPVPRADSETEQDQDADDQPVETHDTRSRGRGRPPKKRARSDSAHPSDLGQDSRSSRKKKKYDRKVKFAEDGTTKSAPLPGQVFDMAFVEINALRNRARNEYVFIRDVPDIRPEDLVSWSEDEEEENADDEQDDSDEEPQVVGFDSMGRVKTKRKCKQPDTLPDGTVLSSCHQCRRKTPGIKMRCGREGCTLSYCERCITVRYYDITFDPYDPNLTCPRCLGFCNCSVCLRRSGHGDLLEKGRKHILAYSRQRSKLALNAQLDGHGGAEDEAQEGTLDTHNPTPKQRRSYNKAIRPDRLNPGSPVIGPAKRRGRPPKKRESFAPVKIDLDLSDEVAEGEVYSPLEEYVLGRLHVARRVFKLIAAEQAAALAAASLNDAESRPKLVVKLRIPSRPRTPSRTFAVADNVAKNRKMSHYNDMEKNVWVRSAADMSTSESEAGDLTDRDLEDDTEEEDELEDEDGDEASFEEGRTQSFAASLLQRYDTTSFVDSKGSSPLTSLDGASSQYSVASSQYSGAANEQSHQAEDSAEEPSTSTQGSVEVGAPSASLGMHDMQQLALAVLEDHDGDHKAVHASVLRLHEPLAFSSSSGSEGGQLGALLSSRSAASTPLMFSELAFSDLDQ